MRYTNINASCQGIWFLTCLATISIGQLGSERETVLLLRIQLFHKKELVSDRREAKTLPQDTSVLLKCLL